MRLGLRTVIGANSEAIVHHRHGMTDERSRSMFLDLLERATSFLQAMIDI